MKQFDSCRDNALLDRHLQAEAPNQKWTSESKYIAATGLKRFQLPMYCRSSSAQLKERVLAECAKPGASVATIALAHGLNANVVHKWRRLAAGTAPVPTTTFVPVSVTPALRENAVIRIELRRGVTAVNVAWPLTAAGECVAWLRELTLRSGRNEVWAIRKRSNPGLTTVVAS